MSKIINVFQTTAFPQEHTIHTSLMFTRVLQISQWLSVQRNRTNHTINFSFVSMKSRFCANSFLMNIVMNTSSINGAVS